MATAYYPRIHPKDHDLHRAVLGPDLGDLYLEWFDRARREMRQIILAGDEPVEIDVGTDEYASWCHETRSARTLNTLKMFAAEKGRRLALVA